MGAFDNDASIEGDVYVQRLATYIRRNEEALANGLLSFSKARTPSKVKPLRPSFTTHHLYYITERIENSSLDVDVGPLNVKLDNPNHEPTFISFMANNARSSRNFESDARSITSINSVKSIVSSASVYWMSFSFSRDPRVIQKDVKYLYSSFTKIPCLILSPRTKTNSILGYEEYPCDTSVPLKMFKNLQVLELVEYEPNEVFGWHTLSERLRILIIRNTKVSDLAEIIYTLVLEDENGRSSFKMLRQNKKNSDPNPLHDTPEQPPNAMFLSQHRRRAMTASTPVSGAQLERNLSFNDGRTSHFLPTEHDRRRDHASLSDNKWYNLKQLTVTESSISHIPTFVFKPLSNLVKLNLSKNLLEDLPDGLHQLQSIKYLNFADNYITSLKKLPTNLSHLVTINFNNNKIEDLSGLQNLKNIEKIDLRRNNLSDLAQLCPLVEQISGSTSKLNNIYISSNKLHRTYRADLFNLFNGVKPKNSIKIDDSRPGYFESAMLLDPDSAHRYYTKFMKTHAYPGGEDLPQTETSESPAQTAKKEEKIETPQSTPAPEAEGPSASDNFDAPQKAATPKSHTRESSVSESLECLSSLKIQDLENSMSRKKRASIMTTATTGPSSVIASVNNSDTTSPSPSMRNSSKSFKPLLPNQNLTNQLVTSAPKMPPLPRQLSSPIIYSQKNGSSSTIKSSSTMNRIDFDSPSSTNLAPSVITPVQVQVEGFQ